MRRMGLVGMLVAVAVVGMLGQGCTANRTGNYGEFYRSASVQDYPKTSDVHVMAYSKETLKKLQGEGAIVVGESSFAEEMEEKEYAIRQARLVGADIVLLSAAPASKARHVTPSLVIERSSTQTQPSVDSTRPEASTGAAAENGNVSVGLVGDDMFDQWAVFLRTKRAR